ncbi:hypothetical protein Bca4012_036257 [Brassica carinata]|uniref:Uncharacterized protein n=1 Tax=Brassica carinata TaxID=52824 RepID=A0A8X7WDC8_BRACI|nr:hypothetical protein Bca52824_009985 [Brassica carinata]
MRFTVDAGVDLVSNTKSFCTFQIPQRTQGRTSKVRPVGDVIETHDAGFRSGTRFQTCLAKGQSKNRCISVSSSLQWGQEPPTSRPLCWRLAPRGKAPRQSFHRKILSFSEVLQDQTCRFQVKSVGRFVGAGVISSMKEW